MLDVVAGQDTTSLGICKVYINLLLLFKQDRKIRVALNCIRFVGIYFHVVMSFQFGLVDWEDDKGVTGPNSKGT
jgi:hypothetical protein